MANKRTRKKTEKPSVLAFERKLEPSDALLLSGNWNDRADSEKWEPVRLQEKTAVGTVVNRLKPTKEDPTIINLEEEDAIIQTVHAAALPMEHDTLKVEFTLRVRKGFWEPSACNSPIYRQRIETIVEAYLAENGLQELSRRYARNLANARFLWRNRISAEEIQVNVELLKKGEPVGTLSFDSLSESLRDMRSWEPDAEGLSELAGLIAKGLRGEEHILLRVKTFARVGAGQEVFPSQEFVQGLTQQKKKEKGVRTKTLYQVKDVAALHSQKVGNALRTIDDWYPEAAENGPIPVEAYGSVTSRGEAYRKSVSENFYGLFDDWILKEKAPREKGQQHYVMAMLIRGGVFGEAEKKQKKS